MNRTHFAARAFLALALAWVAAAPAAADLDPKYDPKKLQHPPLDEIQKIDPERYTLPNGMVVYLLENHELPLVTGTAYVKAGSVWDPPAKVGLGNLTGRVMRTGGTAEHSGDWLDDRLAAIGADLGAAIGPATAQGSFQALSENAGEVLGYLAEVLRRPAFPEDKLELAKVEQRRSIAGRNDEMLPLLTRVATQAIYGKDSPYARVPEYATIEAITRDDLVAFHRDTFVPERTILAVYGDFKSKDMKRLIARHFGDWKKSGRAAPELPPLPQATEPRVVFAPKDDVTQSGIILAHLGFRADAPDAPAMEIVETYLGGGFQSRLFNRIRTERGLAYATGAQAGSGFFWPGVFLAFSLTRTDSTMVALDVLREELRAVTAAAPSEAELNTAKNTVLNNFVFRFEEPSQVLFRAAFLEMAGYPRDYLERYQKGLRQVDAASALAAARAHIHPERAAVILVGKESDFDRPLDAVGMKVERVDITIPPPPSKVQVSEASPQALEQGRRWLATAADQAGGSAAWKAVKSVAIERKATMTVQGQSISITGKTEWVFPDKRRDVLQLPQGTIVQASDGNSGWAEAFGQVQDRPDVAAQVKKTWENSLFHLFADPQAVPIQALPETETVDGQVYRVAFVNSEEVKDWKIYFDEQGRIARMSYQGTGPAGPAAQVDVYGDWRAVGGLQYPHSRRVLIDGETFLTENYDKITLNPQVSATGFAKPQ